MENTQAQKLMPVYLTFEDIVAYILSDSGVTDVIDSRITLDEPMESSMPYVFFTSLGPNQRNTDDRRAIFFWNTTDWRLVAPTSWSKQEMRNFMDKILVKLQEFEGKQVNAITLKNTTTAQVTRVAKQGNGVFFDDPKKKGYKSFIYSVEFQYT